MSKTEKAESKPVTLAGAILAAQKAAQAVAKASKNSFHKYAYASSEDVIEEARRALAEGGLTVLPIQYGVDDRGLSVKYLVCCDGSDQSLTIDSITPIVPDKGRPPDKAVACAKTYDLAYTLRGLVLLPRVEEGTEVDQRDDRNKEPRKFTPGVAPGNGKSNIVAGTGLDI